MDGLAFYLSHGGLLPEWPGHPYGVLTPVEWNDWFKFSTVYRLTLVLSPTEKLRPGQVKIARTDMGNGGWSAEAKQYTTTPLPTAFEALGTEYFSLGQSENYYETIRDAPDDFADRVLVALRDCAYDNAILDRNLQEPVMGEALLRSVERSTVQGRFHSLATGNAELTHFSFSHPIRPEDVEVREVSLRFDVEPGVSPPTNLHALIGRNGVGKTRYLGHLIEDVMKQTMDTREFRSVVHLSLSAFDDLILDIPPKQERTIPFELVTIREKNEDDGTLSGLKARGDLAKEFVRSLAACRDTAQARRWSAAVEMLEADPLFDESRIREIGLAPSRDWKADAERRFSKMSSGHAAVLLSITRLVELVEERTLVLLDEPESHLHPPLLSNFIRTVSSLLISRNGVAIVATHSPVVLQEIPRSCVWVLGRTGYVASAERPRLETFGESVGVLTTEVFGLEVTSSGFHALLREAVHEGGDYATILARFGGNLGAEAKSIVRGLVAEYAHERA